MTPRRRRTDHLPLAEALPADPLDRARVACEALAQTGYESAAVFCVPHDGSTPTVCAVMGEAEATIEAAAVIAEGAAHAGRAVMLADGPSLRREFPASRMAAVPIGDSDQHRYMLVAVDPVISQRDAEAIAAWIAPAEAVPPVAAGACGSLANTLALEYDADAVVFALFTQSGMVLNLHVRSGGLLRAWRLPADTVWGEAARHAAAFMLGELQMHPGAESLASLGMRTAAVVGIENGHGVTIGSIGLASRGELSLDVPRELLERASLLGPQVMALKSRGVPTVHQATSVVELRGFAARVGCRRFALYTREGTVLRLASAHAQDGSLLVAPPDPYEEQIVCWAAEKRIAIVSEDAAAVMVGEDTVLYAQDPRKVPMDCLRDALQALRGGPDAPAQEDLAA